MPNDDSDSLEHIPLDALARVHQVCERFEKELRSSSTVSLDDFMAQLPPEGRRAGFRELLALQIEHIRAAGGCPTADEYIERYPQCADTIASVLQETQIAIGGTTSPPSDLGDYHILRELGRGGMGVVYLAEQILLDRRVALKVLSGARDQNPVCRERFQREAKAAASLQHANIVPVYGVGRHNGFTFYVMRYIKGRNLSEVVRARTFRSGSPSSLSALRSVASGSRPASSDAVPASGGTGTEQVSCFRKIAHLIRQAALGLSHAHEEGIVHRDIKPSNLLLDEDGKLWITDFGLAKSMVETAELTQPGDVGGTLKYMAPEFARGQCDFRSDIYGLGVTMYEILTGRSPFRESNPAQLLKEIVSGYKPLAPRQIDPSIPVDLQTICLKSMQREPSARYQTSAELAEDLQRFLQNEPILARRAGVLKKLSLWAKRNPLFAALTVLVGLLTVGMLAGLSYGISATRNQVLSESARADAETRRWKAESQKAESERTARLREQDLRERVEASLVYSRVALAENSWVAGHVLAARRLLQLCAPQPGQTDYRGWEWHHVNRLCHAEQLILQHSYWVNSVAFSPDDRWVAVGSGNPGSGVGDQLRHSELHIWDVEDGNRVAILVPADEESPAIRHVEFADSGRWLIARDAGSNWHVWRTEDWVRVLSCPGIAGACLPEQDVLAVVGPEARLLHYDLIKGGQPAVIRDKVGQLENRRSAAFTQNRRFVAIRAFDEPEVHVVNAVSGESVTIAAPPTPGFLAVSQKGRHLVDGEQHWHVATGESRGRMIPPGVPIFNPLFSPREDWLVWTMGGRQDLCVTTTDSSIKTVLFRGHSGQITHVTFNAEGSLVATCSADKTIRVWDLSGKVVRVLSGHESGVRNAQFSHNGKLIASGGMDGTVRLWDMTRDPRGVSVVRRGGMGEFVSDIAFSADANHIVVAEDTSVNRYRLQDNSVDLHTRRSFVYSGRIPRGETVLAADGRFVIGTTNREPRVVKVWDVSRSTDSPPLRDPKTDAAEAEANGLVHRLEGHTAPVKWVTADGTGQRFASVAFEDQSAKTAELFVWNAAEIQHRIAALPTTCLRLGKDGQHLAGWSSDRKVHVWKTDTGTEEFQLEMDQQAATCLAFSSDSGLLAGSSRRKVWVWDMKTGEVKSELQTSSRGLTCVTFSPDGQRIATTGIDEGSVELWDTRTGEKVATLHSFTVSRPAAYAYLGKVIFSPDGHRIAANNWDRTISVWEAAPIP